MKIAIIHYTSWPVIGGVESVIRQHAQLMTRQGHEVAIICGEGAAFDKQIRTVAFRELNSQEPLVRAAQEEVFNV